MKANCGQICPAELPRGIGGQGAIRGDCQHAGGMTKKRAYAPEPASWLGFVTSVTRILVTEISLSRTGFFCLVLGCNQCNQFFDIHPIYIGGVKSSDDDLTRLFLYMCGVYIFLVTLVTTYILPFKVRAARKKFVTSKLVTTGYSGYKGRFAGSETHQLAFQHIMC